MAAGSLEDLRYAVRSAWKRPGRSLVVVLSLALGLGANVSVFSYLDFLLWAELPAWAPERLVAVEQEAVGGQGPFSFLALFGVLGLALAGLGLGSAMSFSVSRRTREIGVRMALGPTPQGALGLVLRRALLQVALGVVLGLGATLAFLRLLAGLMQGTETTADPLTLLATILVLFAVGPVAAWAPAQRAARIDPSVAFRAE